MRASSTFAMIQDGCHEAQGDVIRMMRLPQGFTAEVVPEGWHIQPIAANWYYGLRLVEEPMPTHERNESPCMS